MSRLQLVHTTRFTYEGPVTASYNEARMMPLSGVGQSVLEASVSVDPHTWRHEYRDYWGTAVTAFEVTVPHDVLLITASARVDVTGTPWPVGPAGWSQLERTEVRDRLGELLADTPTTAPPAEVVDLARAAVDGKEPLAAAEAVCVRLREAVEYVPGATAVQTAAADAWAERKGVCQDMAHLSVGALRSVGIPARYVSGYLHPSRDAELGTPTTGESHAWVEWWVGQWVAFDPTNGIPVGEHHVVLGRGREYNDVAPLRGIFAGAGTDRLDVQVEITQER